MSKKINIELEAHQINNENDLDEWIVNYCPFNNEPNYSIKKGIGFSIINDFSGAKHYCDFSDWLVYNDSGYFEVITNEQMLVEFK